MFERAGPPRAWMLSALSALAMSITAQQCTPLRPTPPAVVAPTTVDIDLVNQTIDPVDPGLLINGVFFDLGVVAARDGGAL